MNLQNPQQSLKNPLNHPIASSRCLGGPGQVALFCPWAPGARILRAPARWHVYGIGDPAARVVEGCTDV